MPLKIFRARGEDEISQLEGSINGWLEQHSAAIQVKQVATAATDYRMRQVLVVTIWYEGK